MESAPFQIIVGFDFSLGGWQALKSAAQIARWVGGAITVVTAVPGAVEQEVLERLQKDSRSKVDDPLMADVEVFQEVENQVSEQITRLQLDDIPVSFDVGRTNPDKMIHSSGAVIGADLLVVGASGNRRPPEGQRIGIDTERLLRRSQIATLVVREGIPFPPARILCAVDYTPASEAAMRRAIWLAELSGAEIDVLHIIEQADAKADWYKFSFPLKYSELQETVARERMGDFMAKFELGSVVANPRLRFGLPFEEIIEVTKEGFDLLVLGSHGRSAIAEFFIGGTAERVFRQVGCHFLAVRADDYGLRGDGPAAIVATRLLK
ncbi:MAG: universal stress protein [Myxococcales bacterium]|nr:universal stress protein [Myxococcales bacterium]